METHVAHHAEAHAHEPLYATTRVLEVDEKRLRLFHNLQRTRDDVLLATAEQVYLHVNTAAEKSAPMDAAVRARLAAVQSAQARLPLPPGAGRLAGRSAR